MILLAEKRGIRWGVIHIGSGYNRKNTLHRVYQLEGTEEIVSAPAPPAPGARSERGEQTVRRRSTKITFAIQDVMLTDQKWHLKVQSTYLYDSKDWLAGTTGRLDGQFDFNLTIDPSGALFDEALGQGGQSARGQAGNIPLVGLPTSSPNDNASNAVPAPFGSKPDEAAAKDVEIHRPTAACRRKSFGATP